MNNLNLAHKKARAKENGNEKEFRRERIRVGEKARVTNNTRKTQEQEGTVIRVNKDSGFLTVLGGKKSGTIRRSEKNLIKIDSFTYF